MQVRRYAGTQVRRYAGTHLRIYVSMYLCIYVSMYVCMYVCPPSPQIARLEPSSDSRAASLSLAIPPKTTSSWSTAGTHNGDLC